MDFSFKGDCTNQSARHVSADTSWTKVTLTLGDPILLLTSLAWRPSDMFLDRIGWALCHTLRPGTKVSPCFLVGNGVHQGFPLFHFLFHNILRKAQRDRTNENPGLLSFDRLVTYADIALARDNATVAKCFQVNIDPSGSLYYAYPSPSESNVLPLDWQASISEIEASFKVNLKFHSCV